jgi:hypothetical protein
MPDSVIKSRMGPYPTVRSWQVIQQPYCCVSTASQQPHQRVCMPIGKQSCASETALCPWCVRTNTKDACCAFPQAQLVHRLHLFCAQLQEDTFIPTMSSHETLAFYAGVMLGKPWTHASRRERVEQVLDAMGLSKSADTPVSHS